MPTPVTIPKASISMEEGTILKWLLAEGDPVSPETLLLELETDKAIIDVPAPAHGILLKIVTHHGSVRVEEVVGWVGEPGESLDTAAPQKPVEAADQPNVASVEAPMPARNITPSTPAARRRARELRIDLATVNGSGPRGRITEEDVERAAAAPLAAAVVGWL